VTVVAVANQKGGVAKTATAVSVGAVLAQEGKRVLLIDIDPQANATSALGGSRASEPSIYSVLVEEGPIIHAITHTAVERLDLIPSAEAMAGAEIELVPVLARELRLRSAITALRGYDLVLIDCPPSLGLLTINALVASDAVVVPVQSEYLALEGLAQLTRTIDAVRSRLNPRLEIAAILLTMHDSRNRLASDVADELKRHFPQLLSATRIPRTVRLAEAPSHGQPITVYAPGSSAAAAYADFAHELLARLASRDLAPAQVAS